MFVSKSASSCGDRGRLPNGMPLASLLLYLSTSLPLSLYLCLPGLHWHDPVCVYICACVYVCARVQDGWTLCVFVRGNFDARTHAHAHALTHPHLHTHTISGKHRISFGFCKIRCRCCALSPPLHISTSPPLHLSTSPPLHLSLSLHLSTSLSLSPSLYKSRASELSSLLLILPWLSSFQATQCWLSVSVCLSCSCRTHPCYLSTSIDSISLPLLSVCLSCSCRTHPWIPVQVLLGCACQYTLMPLAGW